MKKIVLIAALLSGCASMGSEYVPLVDRPNENFYADLEACQAHAKNEAGAADGALFGGAFGAVLGAVLAPKEWRGDFAKAGAIGGMTGGAAGALNNQRNIVINCMKGRGHNVLR